MRTSDWVTIAKVTRPHGVAGEVKALPLTDFPERFSKLGTAYLEFKDGTTREVGLERARHRPPFVILKFAQVDSASEAEALRNSFLVIGRDQTVELPPDRFYDFELTGLRVETEAGEQVGLITDVLHFPANDVYVVERDKQEILVPAIRDVVTEIDVNAGCMRIKALDGLLE